MNSVTPCLTRALVLLALLALASFPAFAGSLVIDDPWTPEAPPGRMMAGFMTLTNTGEEPIVLIDAFSPLFERIEIHSMINDDGVMRMRRLERLTIEPGESASLESGGQHLMLMRPGEKLVKGDEIPITLIDSNGAEHDLISVVRSRPTR